MTETVNVVNDIEKLTCIPKKYLDKIRQCAIYSINEGVADLTEEYGNQVFSFDIGIGTLSLLMDDSTIKYKFIPCEELESSLRSTVKTSSNSLELKFEESAVNKIKELYKDLL